MSDQLDLSKIADHTSSEEREYIRRQFASLEFELAEAKERARVYEEMYDQEYGLDRGKISVRVDKFQAEITKRESEHQQAIQLERAAIVRELATHKEIWIEAKNPDDLIQGHGACSCEQLKADGVTKWDELWRKHIQSAIPTDQPALDRALADAHEDGYKMKGEIDEVKIAKLQAQTAALLEKAAELPEKLYPRDSVFGLLKQNIRALIATSAAAALEERERKARLLPELLVDMHENAAEKAESVGALKMLKNAEAAIGRYAWELHCKTVAELRAEQGAKQP